MDTGRSSGVLWATAYTRFEPIKKNKISSMASDMEIRVASLINICKIPDRRDDNYPI